MSINYKQTIRLNIRQLKLQDLYYLYKDCVKHREYFYANTNFFNNPLYKEALNFVAETKDSKKLIAHSKGFIKNDYNCFWLQTLMIHPKHLRQLYGTEFFLGIEEIIRTIYNVNNVCLSVHNENKTAHLFWKSLGFQNKLGFNKKVDNELLSTTIYEKRIY
ncbi:MAG: GNAT family N-acetyltransferase [Eubacteriales bacterium]